jgi:hypothetical protein
MLKKVFNCISENATDEENDEFLFIIFTLPSQRENIIIN